MGSLSNLYISQSYQSLIHLGTDNTASVDLIELQDGLGNPIGVAVNTAGDLFLSGSLTASLQEGYLYVGDGNGKTIAVATSSIATTIDTGSLVTTASFNQFTQSINSYTQSNDTVVNALVAATASYVTETESGSFLITASFDNGTRNLTFTKGNNTTFAVIIPDVSGSTFDTGSFATTGSNTFTGDNYFSQSVEILGSLSIPNGTIVMGYPKQMGDPFNYNAIVSTPGINAISSGGRRLVLQGDVMGNAGAKGVTILNGLGITGSVVISPFPGMFPTGGDLDVYGTLTASLQEGYVWVGNASGRTTTVATSSFGGGTIDTSSFATTGSNVFTGDQTLIDNEGNSVTLTDASGSLMLVAKGFTSASAHLVGNPNQVNLIFKNTNDTLTTVISGSANLLSNTVGTLAGLRREITGNGNIALQGANIPYVSASMAFPIVASGNTYNAPFIARGPVSASAWSITNNTFNGQLLIGAVAAANHARGLDNTFGFNSNVVLAQSIIIANGSSIKGQVVFGGSIINGTTFNLRQSGINASANSIGASTINNDYFSGSAGNGFITLSGNLIQGINTINFTGSLDAGVAAQPVFNNSILYGVSNIVGLNATGAGALHSVAGSGIIGGNLIVTGSSAGATAATVGSMFVGRFNAVDGNKARTAQTVFAVGTGTSTANRKTGFLIDSGSNIFMEGAVNISGSLLVNGSTVDGNNFPDGIIVQDQRFITGSQNSIYIGNRTNFNPATTGVPSQFSHTVIGNGALQSFVLGDRNTVYGRSALQSMTTGSDNFGLGAFAGEGLRVGNSNFFVGTGAASNFIEGNDNLFIGNAVANQFRSGSSNVFIGQSMTGLQFVSGSGNLMFGRYGDKVLDNIDNQFSVTYGKLDAGKINLFYKSGSQNDNLYLYGGLEVETAVTASTALINGNLTIQSGSSFFANGNKQFNVGEFASLVTQSGSAGVSQSVNLDVTNISQGVTVASNSQITLANSGTYSITFSAQILASGGQDTFWMWLKKNGVNVPNSATKLIAKNGEESVMTVEYIVEAAANDYYQIVYQNLSGNAFLLYEVASGNIPAIPSIIVSVKQCR